MNNTPTETKPRDVASEIITSGHIPTAVWYLAWPTVINTFFFTAYNVINRVFLGHAGGDTSKTLAAVGVGGVVLMAQSAIMFGISAGGSALISRFLGAQENQDADEATGQSITLSAIAAVLSGVPIALFGVEVARIAGAKGGVAPLAGDYMAIIALFGSVPMSLRFTIQTALRSSGDTRSPLYAAAVLVGLNILLDWLLILGPGPFPTLGVRGAAIATVISHAAALVVILIFLRRSVLRNSVRHLAPHFEWFGRIMRIGWPAIAQNIMFSSGFVVFVWILSLLPDATTAQAALTVAITIEMTAFMPGVAYSIAATPLVGQNLGAGQPKRAAQSAWIATWQAVGIMSLVAVLFLTIPRQLALLFTTKEPVVRHIVTYLQINGVCEPFLAVAMVLTGALQGAGDTFYPMLIEFLCSWVVRLPLAWLLAVHLGYGATGAWIAMATTTFLYGVLVAGWFKMGRWREVRV